MIYVQLLHVGTITEANGTAKEGLRFLLKNSEEFVLFKTLILGCTPAILGLSHFFLLGFHP